MSKGSPPGKYGTSIFLNGLEERIDSELVVRPIDILLQMEEDAAVLGVPVLTPASGPFFVFLWNANSRRKFSNSEPDTEFPFFGWLPV